MAFWNCKNSAYEEMMELIEEKPGINPAELARKMGVERSTIQRRLPSMDEAGYLLGEDNDGGLYPFRRLD